MKKQEIQQMLQKALAEILPDTYWFTKANDALKPNGIMKEGSEGLCSEPYLITRAIP